MVQPTAGVSCTSGCVPASAASRAGARYGSAPSGSLVIGVRGAVVDEPVVGVEHEHLGRPRRAVGARRLLRLVVEEREDEALLLGPGPHVVGRVAEVAGVRVDRQRTRPARRSRARPRSGGLPTRPRRGSGSRRRRPRRACPRSPRGCASRRRRRGARSRAPGLRAAVLPCRQDIDVPDLYDAVGHGMWAYSNAAVRVSVLDRERFAPRARDAHRRHAPARDRRAGASARRSTSRMGGRRNTTDRLHFAARDDMFLPGFFAGFPPDLPLRARRLLYRVGVAAGCRASTSSRSGARAWRAWERCWPPAPEQPARRAASRGSRRRASSERALAARARGSPARGADVLRGESTPTSSGSRSRPEDTPGLDEFWSAQGRAGRGRLPDARRDRARRQRLVVFPEGRPSPDGEIGPIRPGIGALVRRGKPRGHPPAGDRLRPARPRPHARAPRPRPARAAAPERTSRACSSRCCA